jgi:hypothetical protein
MVEGALSFVAGGTMALSLATFALAIVLVVGAPLLALGAGFVVLGGRRPDRRPSRPQPDGADPPSG